jgi:hypothetical protein
MKSIKKQILSSLTIAILTSLVLIGVTSLNSPDVDNFWVIAVVVFLIYIVSVCLIYVVLILLNGKQKKSTLPYSLLFGCFPPALLMLISLKQAGFFDIFIILATAAIILWYANYKS